MMARPELSNYEMATQGLKLIAFLGLIGLFAVMGILMAVNEPDPGKESTLRVQLWCEGFAVGITDAVVRQGFQPPFEDDWARLIGQCKDGEIYLNPYVIQPGFSPPNAQDSLYADIIPSEPTTAPCIPSIARQC